MKASIGKIGKWLLLGLGAAAVLVCLYLSVFFFPYPLFPNHAEFAGFSVYSDREIPGDFELVLDDARRRVEAMELYRADNNLRIFLCSSQRKFVTLIKLAGKRHAGQALVISAAGNAFFSEEGIEGMRQRTGGRPVHSRLEGSWSAAIAHEVAHQQMVATKGSRKARTMPTWKSEGYADYAANVAAVASDPDYDFRSRIGLLLDENRWRPPVRPFDRRHFRWHLMVEYLCNVRGLRFEDLLNAGVTEESAWDEMIAWYLAFPASDTADPRWPAESAATSAPAGPGGN